MAAACGGGSDDGDGGRDGEGADAGAGSELVVARARDLESLNADAITASREGWETYELIAQPLYMGNSEGDLVPGVASEYTVSDDQLSWTFTIRDGITFSNGAPVTSADVAFTIENAQEGPLQGALYQAITSIETPDENTIVLSTDEPNSGLIWDLAAYPVAVIPEDFAGMDPEEFWRTPIGTGPYMVETWSQGVEVVLVPNPHYWGDEPALDRLTFRPVPDENTRMLQLRNGDVDIVEDPAYAQLTTIEADGTLDVVEFPNPTAIFVTVDTTKPPFDDVHARRAVSLAIDRDALVEAGLRGYGQPAGSFIAASAMGGHEPEFGLAFDPAEAAAELARSATPDGFTFELMYDPAVSSVTAAVQVVQANLADVGITVELNGLDRDAQQAKRDAGDWDATIATIISGSDAGGIFQYYGSTNGFYSGSQLMSEVESEWQASNSDFSDGGRLETYRDLVTRIAEDAPQIGLYSPTRLYGTGPAVGSVAPRNPTGAIDYAAVVVN
ncbi:ABC transporter substrate-binding protein [Phytoactinopolyspora limicola]|uniref:ABC transporter substrate-binding protein n=1 Tax=Phytoactinopolyspora limicola TaxID=2715536 RepID=UPI0014089477|nr:ABC transporter substrate-binding protein [Phytoactinopolyspora limicola]